MHQENKPDPSYKIERVPESISSKHHMTPTGGNVKHGVVRYTLTPPTSTETTTDPDGNPSGIPKTETIPTTSTTIPNSDTMPIQPSDPEQAES